jgi:hypothetical protein
MHVCVGFKFIGLLAFKNITLSTAWAFIGNNGWNKIFSDWFSHSAAYLNSGAKVTYLSAT